jgi:hypothetical protein
MRADEHRKWKAADVQQIDTARAFGFEGRFKLEAALKLPSPPPKPVPGLPLPRK